MKTVSVLLNFVIAAVAAVVVIGFPTSTADISAQTGYPPPELPAGTPVPGSRNVFLPLVSKYYPVQPKTWSGMHLGNRNGGDWTSNMLAPFDGTRAPSATWPRITVNLSRQVFNVGRDANCRITKATISVRNAALYNYLRNAALSGQVSVMLRIWPSPGNFEESIQPTWFDPNQRTSSRTLIIDEDRRPGNWLACSNDERFRTIADIGDEILAIQGYVQDRGWAFYGFTPANEPNVEWYGAYGNTRAFPDYTQGGPWAAMDEYFYRIYDYVHSRQGAMPVRVFTPPMAQNANAEVKPVVGNPSCVDNVFSGYAWMVYTFDSLNPKNDGYVWHNYFIAGKESWTDCPNGQHVSKYFPANMARMIRENIRPAYILEADLAPPQFGWGNSITNKGFQASQSATSIRSFLYQEASASGGQGAKRIAAWLLNDDCNNANAPCPQHQWAQAYNSNPGTNYFFEWFNQWWFLPE